MGKKPDLLAGLEKGHTIEHGCHSTMNLEAGQRWDGERPDGREKKYIVLAPHVVSFQEEEDSVFPP